MSPLERYMLGQSVKWSDFKTYEERKKLYRVFAQDCNHHVDFEYVGWVDHMNLNYYPDGEFTR